MSIGDFIEGLFSLAFILAIIYSIAGVFVDTSDDKKELKNDIEDDVYFNTNTDLEDYFNNYSNPYYINASTNLSDIMIYGFDD